MKRLLMHVCCGSCSIIAIERTSPIYDVVLYFSNSNVYPQGEYEKRLENTQKIAEIYGIEMINDTYNLKDWLIQIKGYENEPENGKRCSICINYRLDRTATYAREQKFDIFTTTLTTGPQKNAELINSIGRALEIKYGIEFYDSNFKKKDGFKRSVEISKKYNLYRQNYCGCKFSIKKL